MGVKLIFHFIGLFFAIPLAWTIYTTIWNPPDKGYEFPIMRGAHLKDKKESGTPQSQSTG